MYKDANINIGTLTSSTSSWNPYCTYYYDNKVQFIIFAAELQNAGITLGARINGITLQASSKPGRNLVNVRIRLKETEDTSLTAWHTTGLVLVYEETSIDRDLVTSGDYYKHVFNQEYVWNGKNILVEISRDDYSYSSGGGNYLRTGLSAGRMLTGYQDSGYTFPFDTMPIRTKEGSILDISFSYDNSNFKSSGTYVSSAIQMNEEIKICWDSLEPENTEIKIEVSTGETLGEWQQVLNGDVIISNTNLWIKATLSTEDITQTPVLTGLWIEEAYPPENIIQLVFHPQSRFNNAEGQLLVEYDQSIGDLQGKGGFVESFEKAFLPTDLEPMPNPSDIEKIKILPSINLSFKYIYYKYRYGSDTVKVTASCIVNFINVEDINP